MSKIIVPKRQVWTRQPPKLASIAGGSLSDGLLACITPFGDHVTRRLLASTGTPAREVTGDGEAIKFVNANSYGLSLGSAARYNPPNMTIFAVVNVGAVGTRVLWARDAIANRAFALDVEFGWRFYIAGGAPILTTPASVGRAVVAVVVRGTTAGLYLNGVLADVSASMPSMPAVNTQTTLGYRIYEGHQNYFDGSVPIAAMWNRALTNDEIRALYINPWQLLERAPRRLWVVDSGGGAPTGLATETDTAFALSVGGTPVGLAAETDTAFALAGVQLRAVGLAAETDTAFALTAIQAQAVGLAAETDTAFALSTVLTGATGLAAETDTALTLSGPQARAVGLATEVDAALPLAATQSQLVGLATEADTALALSAGASTPVGLAAETDTAFALAGVQAQAVGLSAETDTALARGSARPTDLATETDTAFALSATQLKAAGLAAETDTAFVLASARPAGLAVETDTAFSLTAGSASSAGLASENDTAFALGAIQLKAVGLSAESDTAFALSAVQLKAVGLATEADTAFALSAGASTPVGLAAETDTAFAFAAVQIAAVGLAVETDIALARPLVQVGSVQMALEIEVAFALPAVQRASVGMAVESDSALALNPGSTGGVAGAADVWNYVLSNGLTAEQTAVQTHAMLTALLASCPADLALVLKLLRNKQVTNPSTGRMTVYDDDGSTVLLEGNLFEDAAGTQRYRGQGAERRERLT